MIDEKIFETAVDNVEKLTEALLLTASRMRALECFALELVQALADEPTTRHLVRKAAHGAFVRYQAVSDGYRDTAQDLADVSALAVLNSIRRAGGG